MSIKRKFNKKTILVSLLLAASPSVVNAQWSVANVNDAHYFGMHGVFTRAVAEIMNTVKAAIDANSAILDVTRAQMAQSIRDADIRQRAAMGHANIAKTLMDKVPTLEACSVASASSGMSGGVTVSGAGSGSASGENAVTNAKTLYKEIDKVIMPMKNKKKFGTCSAEDIKSGFAACNENSEGHIAKDEFGGSKSIPSSDLTSLAVKGDTSKSNKVNQENQELANLTISAYGPAHDVALQYITNATMYAAPNALTPDQAKDGRSTLYIPMYNNAMIKLYTAQQAYSDILSSRIELPIESGSVAMKNWQENRSEYEKVMGMKMPEKPSFMDYVTSNVMIDLIGVKLKNIPRDQVGYLRALNEKAKFSNAIALKQLQQQENTNMLLSQILTQLVTPVDMESINDMYLEIDGYIPKEEGNRDANRTE